MASPLLPHPLNRPMTNQKADIRGQVTGHYARFASPLPHNIDGVFQSVTHHMLKID